MDRLKSAKNTIFLVFGSVFIIVVGSAGAYMGVQYFLKAAEPEVSISDIITQPPQSTAQATLGESDPTPDPFFALGESESSLATPTPTATIEPDLPTATPTPESFELLPTATPIMFDASPSATATKAPTELPVTASIPTWALPTAGMMVLLVILGFAV